jgi:hypothetical protein
MPRIACLMMLRDEALLLEPWLHYHGHLFGFENLFVYDNGSVAQTVIAVLRRFAAIGVNVDFSRKERHDFAAKGGVLGEKIIEFQAANSYDIALAVDCDEFIALAGPAGPSVSRNQILAEIERIDRAGAICQTEKCFYNVPGYLDQFWLAGHRKCIVPVPLFRTFDLGLHWANRDDGIVYGATSFTYLHLHHKPFDHVVYGAKQKLQGRVDTANPEALRSFRGVGWHLAKYLLMTREDYYTYLDPGRMPFVRFTGFVRFLEAFVNIAALRSAWEAGRPQSGHSRNSLLDLDETPFDAAAYLAANPDLADVPNLFYHYVEQGFGEGRALEPSLRAAAWRAMQEGRFAEAVPLWAEYRLLQADDPEGYDAAVIACRNAGLDPAEIIAAAQARFPDYFAGVMSPA